MLKSRFFRPLLEALEDRVALANMVWIGGGPVNNPNVEEGAPPPPPPPLSDDWSVATNWRNLDNFNDQHVPVQGVDNVFFDAAYSNFNCNYRGGGWLRTKDMTFRNGYTGVLGTTTNVTGLTVQGDLRFNSSGGATIDLGGSVPCLGVDGLFICYAGMSGKVMSSSGSVWLAGGGFNNGSVTFDVNDVHLNHPGINYVLRGTFHLTKSGSYMENRTDSILSLMDSGGVNGTYTPDFYNYGTVQKLGGATSAFSSVAFINAGAWAKVSVLYNGRLEFFHYDQNKWAYHQSTTGTTEVEEGSTLFIDAFNTNWDGLIERGVFNTIDHPSHTVAWVRCPILYFGNEQGSSVSFDIAGSAIGQIENPFGSFVMRSGCQTFVTLGSNQAADLISAYYVVMGGSLVVTLNGWANAGDRYQICRGYGGNASVAGSWSGINYPEGEHWSSWWNFTRNQYWIGWY